MEECEGKSGLFVFLFLFLLFPFFFSKSGCSHRTAWWKSKQQHRQLKFLQEKPGLIARGAGKRNLCDPKSVGRTLSFFPLTFLSVLCSENGPCLGETILQQREQLKPQKKTSLSGQKTRKKRLTGAGECGKNPRKERAKEGGPLMLCMNQCKPQSHPSCACVGQIQRL